MLLLDRLERKLGRYGVPHVTIALIVAQSAVYLWMFVSPSVSGVAARLELVPDLVKAGEWGRLVSFVIVPPITNPFFFFCGIMLFYLMGTALERQWGALRYNIFLLSGWIATVAVGFLTPDHPVLPAFLGSVFLAFATLYPDFIINLFFVLPVKVKWLALATWLGGGYLFVTEGWSVRFVLLASIVNYLLFFGRDIVVLARARHKRMMMRAALLPQKRNYLHRCETCGITDKTHPQMDFRYCPSCGGELAYCVDHLNAHEHVPNPVAEGRASTLRSGG